jgi:hypothetical protein
MFDSLLLSLGGLLAVGSSLQTEIQSERIIISLSYVLLFVIFYVTNRSEPTLDAIE